MLAGVCFAVSGMLATSARGQDFQDRPVKKRARQGGGKRAKPGQDAAARRQTGRKKRGRAGTVRLAMLNNRTLKELYGKLDADGSGSVSLEEFKALPTVLEQTIKDAAAKAKARSGRKKAVGAGDGGRRRKGGRKKKDPTTQ